MKRLIGMLVLLLTLNAGSALAFNLMTADQVKTKLDSRESITLLDIQVAEEYARHHLRGAVATYAYPVKSEQDQAKVAALLDGLKGTTEPVVIICPRGKGGAKRTYAYLQSSGIVEERLFILENGQSGWPYAELVVGE